MKILFLDDSFLSARSFLGYGGFCIDAQEVRAVSEDIRALKRQKRIPLATELKWSPPQGHYLRTRFSGSRQELYASALRILRKHDARLLCAVHDLSQCYGVKLHGWSIDKAKLWAAEEQMTFLAERFQYTILEPVAEWGLVVSDNYASRKGEEAIIKQVTTDLLTGTLFHKLDRISTIPLMADSKYCFPIQLADLVIGIFVAYLAEGPYATELFPEIATLFAYNPHSGSRTWVSMYTASVLGVGMKLFPPELKKLVKAPLERLDARYDVSNDKGIYERKRQGVRGVGPD